MQVLAVELACATASGGADGFLARQSGRLPKRAFSCSNLHTCTTAFSQRNHASQSPFRLPIRLVANAANTNKPQRQQYEG